jgi:hypothetical protein
MFLNRFDGMIRQRNPESGDLFNPYVIESESHPKADLIQKNIGKKQCLVQHQQISKRTQ